MKIRNGFVSNSSSSSFFIALDRMPRSAKGLQKVLFGDKEEVGEGYCTIPAQRAAEIIFGDIKKRRPVKLKEFQDWGNLADIKGFFKRHKGKKIVHLRYGQDAYDFRPDADMRDYTALEEELSKTSVKCLGFRDG